MKKLLVVVFFLVLMTTLTDTSPILAAKDAKQILRTRREDRPRKAGFPDEPMRYILHSRQKGDVGVSGQCGDRDLFMGTEDERYGDCAEDEIIPALAMCSVES